MRRGRDTLRAAALLATAWWGVHQLRYLLAYGAGAGGELAHQGHAYLAPAAPALGLLLALAAGRLLVRAACAPAGRSPRAQRLTALWPACAAAILALYAAQETAEGLLCAGHPDGLAGIVGHGGWLAIPLALVAGLAVACALRVSERLEDRAARPGLVRLATALPRPAATRLVPVGPARALALTLAREGQSRGPPLACR